MRWLARCRVADESDSTLEVGSASALFEAWRFDEFNAGGCQFSFGEVGGAADFLITVGA